MPLTINHIGKNGKPKKGGVKVIVQDPTYGVKTGQIYLRADGATFGLLVKDIDIQRSDATVFYASPEGWCGQGVIDLFKLAKVRYYEAERPHWWPIER